jgi:hypothetical protein
VKVILSRKGFDGACNSGGGSSPVLPDGRMVSLPIPDMQGLHAPKYCELRFQPDQSYLELLRSLKYKLFNELSVAHLDPDLTSSVRERARGWRGLLGQSGGAATHLNRHNVGPGDLFLFFGRFRNARPNDDGGYEFEGPSFHALWGYLEVGEVIDDAALNPAPVWARGHPHFEPVYRVIRPNNVYVAAERLNAEVGSELPGWGVFRWDERLRLTHPGSQRMSEWRPIECLDPSRVNISQFDSSHFGARGRGQEFVCEPLAPADAEAVRQWALGLIHGARTE